MKAAIRTIYGEPSCLQVTQTDKPIAKDDEVLVKVYATTVNRTDCAILRGKPFVMRLFTGLLRPSSSITGTDFAGQVEEIGKNVNTYKVGDRVFGFNDQGLPSQAEYMCFSANGPMAIIPQNIGFEDAAASLEGAHYALNFLNKISLARGQKAMVNGATGAIGSAIVQFLKTHGLYVVATCGTPQLDIVKAMGADRTIDFTQYDFTNDPEKYDFVFDAVGKSTFGQCKPLLKEKGIYISSELGPMMQNILFALTTPLFGRKKVIFPVPSDIKATLDFITIQLSEGRYKPLIDKHFALDDIADAYRYVSAGKKIGNVIIRMH